MIWVLQISKNLQWHKKTLRQKNNNNNNNNKEIIRAGRAALAAKNTYTVCPVKIRPLLQVIKLFFVIAKVYLSHSLRKKF
jgi:hypothetical protein